MTYLTPHFTLEEYLHSDTADAMGIDNTPTHDDIIHMVYHALMMEGVRHICGDHPVSISSGYRCPQVNAAVGGASNSAHLYGCAADFTIPDFGDVTSICKKLEPYLATLGVDQLIDESGGGARWVHIGRIAYPGTPRYQCLTINSSGTTTGFA